MTRGGGALKRTVTIAQGDVSLVEMGVGSPILFVHGWPANGGAWKRQLEGLSDSFRVLALDLPGFGDSPPPVAPPTMTSFATVVRGVIERLQLEGVVLVGWSMGAGIVMRYCELFGSHRLAGIGIVDDCPRLLPGPDWRLSEDTTFDPAGLDDWRGRWAYDRRGVIRDLTLAEFADTDAHAEEIEWLIEESMRSDPATALSALLDAFDCDFRAGLGAIDVPALLLYGEHSRFTTPKNRTYMEAAIPRSRLVVFPASAHNLMIEEAERFNRELAAFAEEVRGARDA